MSLKNADNVAQKRATKTGSTQESTQETEGSTQEMRNSTQEIWEKPRGGWNLRFGANKKDVGTQLIARSHPEAFALPITMNEQQRSPRLCKHLVNTLREKYIDDIYLHRTEHLPLLHS